MGTDDTDQTGGQGTRQDRCFKDGIAHHPNNGNQGCILDLKELPQGPCVKFVLVKRMAELGFPFEKNLRPILLVLSPKDPAREVLRLDHKNSKLRNH